MYSLSAGSDGGVFLVLPYLIGISGIIIIDILILRFINVLRKKVAIVSSICGFIISLIYLLFLLNAIDRYSTESAEAVGWLLFFHGMPFSLLGLLLETSSGINSFVLFNSILFVLNWSFIGLLLGYAIVLILSLRKELSHGTNN